MNNKELITAYLSQEKDAGSASNKTLHFTGGQLFSYERMIAERINGKVIFNPRGRSSATTNRHIRLLTIGLLKFPEQQAPKEA